MADRTDILGVGFAYPFEIEQSTGGVKRAAGTDLVKMSIQQILNTAVGERFFNRGFGSQIPRLVFEPINNILLTQLEHYLLDAIERWEKRVIVDQVTVDTSRKDEGLLELGVHFTVIKTQEPGNLVFPFYLSSDDRKPQAPSLIG